MLRECVATGPAGRYRASPARTAAPGGTTRMAHGFSSPPPLTAHSLCAAGTRRRTQASLCSFAKGGVTDIACQWPRLRLLLRAGRVMARASELGESPTSASPIVPGAAISLRREGASAHAPPLASEYSDTRVRDGEPLARCERAVRGGVGGEDTTSERSHKPSNFNLAPVEDGGQEQPGAPMVRKTLPKRGTVSCWRARFACESVSNLACILPKEHPFRTVTCLASAPRAAPRQIAPRLQCSAPARSLSSAPDRK